MLCVEKNILTFGFCCDLSQNQQVITRDFAWVNKDNIEMLDKVDDVSKFRQFTYLQKRVNELKFTICK